MSHFGVLCYKGTGHLNPMIALSRQLVSRGHRVTFIQTTELEDKVRAQGLDFRSLGLRNNSYVKAKGRKYKWKLIQDLASLRDGVNRVVSDMEFFLRHVPAALSGTGIDALIIDEISLAGPTVAELLCVPHIIISTSIPHNFGWSGPRRTVGKARWLKYFHRYLLEVSVLRMNGPVRRRLDELRQHLGLEQIHRSAALELAHITQMPQCLDLPRPFLPRNFHYAGPFVDSAARSETEFPWHRLDGRMMVYVSLGTSRGSDRSILSQIAEACATLHLQLVISLGGRYEPEQFGTLIGSPIVVKELPQLAILKRADLLISHGGLNTALEALMEGKPMIVIPSVLDQPAVAARLKWHGIAEVLTSKDLSAVDIEMTIRKVLDQPSYRLAAMKMQASICSINGLEHAVDVIESVLTRHRHERVLTPAN